jgi:cellulose synthase/poly-beta-1,6-N-acetylglucosamine synthase-like glycosyltransferase
MRPPHKESFSGLVIPTIHYGSNDLTLLEGMRANMSVTWTLKSVCKKYIVKYVVLLIQLFFFFSL